MDKTLIIKKSYMLLSVFLIFRFCPISMDSASGYGFTIVSIVSTFLVRAYKLNVWKNMNNYILIPSNILN